MTRRRSARQRRLFVLDTNVLMHDPAAIFRFEEHDIFLPMVVLEELDAHKKGLSEASRNVRQVSRFLDELMRDASRDKIEAGLPLWKRLSYVAITRAQERLLWVTRYRLSRPLTALTTSDLAAPAVPLELEQEEII